MANKLTFGNLIAHFIPGLLLFVVVLNSDVQEGFIKKADFYNWFTQNEVLGSIMVFSIGLALGLCIDALRYLIIRGVWLCKIFQKEFKQAPPQKDELERYNWIIENHYRYHQFCGNLAIVSMAAIILLWGKYPAWPFVVVFAILSLAGGAIYWSTVRCLHEAYPE
ncbi:MAG: hypothetical protein ACYS0C_07670 [Planctomycetota bacterium]|jgi:hypothetical protein